MLDFGYLFHENALYCVVIEYISEKHCCNLIWVFLSYKKKSYVLSCFGFRCRDFVLLFPCQISSKIITVFLGCIGSKPCLFSFIRPWMSNIFLNGTISVTTHGSCSWLFMSKERWKTIKYQLFARRIEDFVRTCLKAYQRSWDTL